MNKFLIIDKGFAKTGKSSALKKVIEQFGEILGRDRVKIIRNEGDKTAIVRYDNGIYIGIETQGDPSKGRKPSQRLQQSLDLFVKNKRFPQMETYLADWQDYQHCDIIIVPCRANGATHKQLTKLESAGYSLIYCPHDYYKCVKDSTGTIIYENDRVMVEKLNQMYSAHIFSIVKSLVGEG